MSTKRQEQIRAQKEGREFIDTTLNQGKRNPAGHYVKNADLRNELIKCKEQDKLTDEAVLMFEKIARRLSVKLKYNDPMDKEDCISFAVLDCIKYWRNYDPSITDNAFAYITTVCRNGFAKGWRALGKMQLPESLKVPISDNLYSL